MDYGLVSNICAIAGFVFASGFIANVGYIVFGSWGKTYGKPPGEAYLIVIREYRRNIIAAFVLLALILPLMTSATFFQNKRDAVLAINERRVGQIWDVAVAQVRALKTRDGVTCAEFLSPIIGAIGVEMSARPLRSVVRVKWEIQRMLPITGCSAAEFHERARGSEFFGGVTESSTGTLVNFNNRLVSIAFVHNKTSQKIDSVNVMATLSF